MTPSPAAAPELDIVIPVFKEGEKILPVLRALQREVRTRFRVLICYDHDEDDTLVALAAHPVEGLELVLVKNRGQGAFGAILSGFEDSSAPAVLMMPADDDFNAPRIDQMMEKVREGCDIVAPSRFIEGGTMEGCPWLKAILVRSSAFVLFHLARLPTRDASNGFRLFSRRVLDTIVIESTMGFTYSIELLVKCHRLGWKVGEVPAQWFERSTGGSRFRLFRWLPSYLVWFAYPFATTWLGRGPSTVKLRDKPLTASTAEGPSK